MVFHLVAAAFLFTLVVGTEAVQASYGDYLVVAGHGHTADLSDDGTNAAFGAKKEAPRRDIQTSIRGPPVRAASCVD